MSFIRRITRVSVEGDRAETSALFRKKSKRRKSPRWARPLEKLTRRAIKAHQAYSNEALRRHNRSAGKRKLGWLRDLPLNAMRARRKAVKVIRN
jgi:hypothetical protein